MYKTVVAFAAAVFDCAKLLRMRRRERARSFIMRQPQDGFILRIFALQSEAVRRLARWRKNYDKFPKPVVLQTNKNGMCGRKLYI